MGAIIPIANAFNLNKTPEPIGTIHKGMDWPPNDQDGPFGDASQRVAWYRTYWDIFDGNHEAVLPQRDELAHYQNYITVNLAKRIVYTFNSLLFGEDLSLEFEEGVDGKTVEEIWDENAMQLTLQEADVDGAAAGDAVFQVRKGEDRVHIEPIPATRWFPELSQGNIRDVKRHVIAWGTSLVIESSKVGFIRMMIHNKGSIEYQLWETESGKLKKQHVHGTFAWQKIMGELPESEQTGVDEFLIVHVPNPRPARRLFGTSEINDDELYSALNARVSQFDSVLTKHADPKLMGGEGFLTDRGEFENKDYYEIQEAGQKLEYIEYDGDLASAKAFIDKLESLIWEISEVAESLVHPEKAGVVSGRALQILARDTLAKVNRKRRYYSKAIPDMLVLAQRLNNEEPVRPKVVWPDGLPQDNLELMEEVRERINLSLISRTRAVQRLDGVSAEDADKLLEDIDEDEGDALTAAVQARSAPKPQVDLTKETEVI